METLMSFEESESMGAPDLVKVNTVSHDICSSDEEVPDPQLSFLCGVKRERLPNMKLPINRSNLPNLPNLPSLPNLPNLPSLPTFPSIQIPRMPSLSGKRFERLLESASAMSLGRGKTRRHLPLPTGVHTVGCLDFMSDPTADSTFARIFYPTNKTDIFKREAQWPLWLPRKEYANGYLHFRRVNQSVLGRLFNWIGGDVYIPALWRASPLLQSDPFPVIILTHGLGGNRTTYTTICTELASQGFMVVAIEHRDGSASMTYCFDESSSSSPNSPMNNEQNPSPDINSPSDTLADEATPSNSHQDSKPPVKPASFHDFTSLTAKCKDKPDLRKFSPKAPLFPLDSSSISSLETLGSEIRSCCHGDSDVTAHSYDDMEITSGRPCLTLPHLLARSSRNHSYTTHYQPDDMCVPNLIRSADSYYSESNSDSDSDSSPARTRSRPWRRCRSLRSRDSYFRSSFRDLTARKMWIQYERQEKEDDYNLRNSQVHRRVTEIQKLVKILQAINNGLDVQNVLDPEISFDLLQFKGRLNFDKLSIVGHSFGGASTIATLAADTRFKVGVALDTWMLPLNEEVYPKVKQPLLLINSETFQWRPNAEQMFKLKPTDLTPCERTLIALKGTCHQSFADFQFVFPQSWLRILNLRNKMPPKVAMGTINTLSTLFLFKHLEIAGASFEDSFNENKAKFFEERNIFESNKEKYLTSLKFLPD